MILLGAYAELGANDGADSQYEDRTLLKYLGISALAIALAFIGSPAVVVAQSAMNSMADCTPVAMHAAMSKMGAQLSSMQSTGDMDKDYAHSMMAMTKDQHDLSAWEIKCGKDAKTAKMAKASMHGAETQYNAWSNLLGGG